mgnify:CR=1 FL=1
MNHSKTRQIIIFFIFLLISLNAKSFDYHDSNVKVALVHYPPYVIQNKAHEGAGIVYDLLKDVDNLTILFLPPKRAIEEYRHNKIDILFFSDKGAYNIVKKNSQFLPLFQGNTHLIYLKDSENTGVISKKTLANKSVAVIRGVGEEAEKLRLLGMKIVEIETPEQSLQMVAKGRIDYSNMSLLPVKYQLNNMKIKEALEFSAKPTFLLNVGLFYSKNPSIHVKKAIDEINNIYLTDRDEIGIFLDKEFQRRLRPKQKGLNHKDYNKSVIPLPLLKNEVAT